MMPSIAVLSHTSALEICRDMRCGKESFGHLRIDPGFVAVGKPEDARKMLKDYPSFLASKKIHFLVFERDRRHLALGADVHYSAIHHGNGSFVRLAPGYAMSSPELMFLEMASILKYEQLLLLGLELCGTFAISSAFERGFENDLDFATNPRKLADYAARMPGMRKIRVAREVISMLQPGSASPQESRAFIKLALPRARGGYGVRGLEFNHEVVLSKKAAKMAGQRVCRIDLAHQVAKLAIEYESAMEHENHAQGQKDKRRRDALVFDGWNVMSIVPSTMNNQEVFDVFARNVLCKVGQCSRTRARDFEAKRDNLFRALRTSD